MRRNALALLVVGVVACSLWLACTRVNPRYCQSDKDCPRDETCNTKADQCQPAPSNADMAMGMPDLVSLPDLGGGGDFATPDMTSPPECAVDKDCAAKAMTPACVAGRCVPCTRNYQCPDAACIPAGAAMGAGSCVAASRMIFVNNDSGKCSASAASGKPYCRIDQALGAVSATKDVILVRASGNPYENNGNYLTITKTVRIIGERADRTAAPPVVNDPVDFRPGGGSGDVQLAFEDLSFTVKNAGNIDVIVCARAMGDKTAGLTLRWTRFEGNPLSAVRSEGCNTVNVLNSTFIGNAAATAAARYAAVYILGGNVKIANSIIAGNGNANATEAGGVFLAPRNPDLQLGTLDLAFNTIADNTCSGTGGSGLACNLFSNKAANMNFSIVTGAAATVAGITLNNSLVPSDYGAGTGNVKAAGNMPVFANTAMGDYHLANDPENAPLRLLNAAPSERTDIDGDPRPTADDKVDVGADQRVP